MLLIPSRSCCALRNHRVSQASKTNWAECCKNTLAQIGFKTDHTDVRDGVKSGKSPMEHMFSALPPIGDIARHRRSEQSIAGNRSAVATSRIGKRPAFGARPSAQGLVPRDHAAIVL